MEIKAAFYQFSPLFGQVQHNLRTVCTAVKGLKADLLVLPELAFTGYNFEDREELRSLAEEPRHSAIVDTLVALCRKADLHIVTGFAEKSGDCLFNSALLIGPEGLKHTYRKLHLFNREKEYFDSGDLPLQVLPVGDARVGMMVCFDWAFPEAARTLALQGADIIAHPSNLVLDYCQRTMIGRSIENRIFTITANRTGREVRTHGTLAFTGRSQIVDPEGRVLGRAPVDKDYLCVQTLKINQARSKHITPVNHLFKDRRTKYYNL